MTTGPRHRLASLSSAGDGGVVEFRDLPARSTHPLIAPLTSLQLRRRLRRPLAPSRQIALPPAGRPFLATLLLLLPLAGPLPRTKPTPPASSPAPVAFSQRSTLQAASNDPERAPEVYRLTPERRALLNTIRFAEGTWAGGDAIGYRIMFGGGLMPTLERHPDRVIRKSGYASAAAGAYQFMPFTWSLASRTLGLQQFGPDVQDQAAIFLIQRRGALALVDQGIFTPGLAAKLAPEWASFPTLAGRSFYGQPVRRFEALKRFYEDNLAQLRGLQPVAKAEEPSCEPADSLRCRVEALQKLP